MRKVATVGAASLLVAGTAHVISQQQPNVATHSPRTLESMVELASNQPPASKTAPHIPSSTTNFNVAQHVGSPSDPTLTVVVKSGYWCLPCHDLYHDLIEFKQEYDDKIANNNAAVDFEILVFNGSYTEGSSQPQVNQDEQNPFFGENTFPEVTICYNGRIIEQHANTLHKISKQLRAVNNASIDDVVGITEDSWVIHADPHEDALLVADALDKKLPVRHLTDSLGLASGYAITLDPTQPEQVALAIMYHRGEDEARFTIYETLFDENYNPSRRTEVKISNEDADFIKIAIENGRSIRGPAYFADIPEDRILVTDISEKRQDAINVQRALQINWNTFIPQHRARAQSIIDMLASRHDGIQPSVYQKAAQLLKNYELPNTDVSAIAYALRAIPTKDKQQREADSKTTIETLEQINDAYLTHNAPENVHLYYGNTASALDSVTTGTDIIVRVPAITSSTLLSIDPRSNPNIDYHVAIMPTMPEPLHRFQGPRTLFDAFTWSSVVGNAQVALLRDGIHETTDVPNPSSASNATYLKHSIGEYEKLVSRRQE